MSRLEARTHSRHPLADERSEAALVCRGALGHGAAIPTREELPASPLAETGAPDQLVLTSTAA